MTGELKLSHIGVAVIDIARSREIYQKLGYMVSEIVYDSIQMVNICFAKNNSSPDIELIQPMSTKSPVSRVLQKNGTTPYHLCYSTGNMGKTILQLRELKFLVIGPIVQAIALNNQKICFLYNRDYGLIELVEIGKV
jgi:methylmalonyl-CoA/ethylmalonyl-CoA epimerase